MPLDPPQLHGYPKIALSVPKHWAEPSGMVNGYGGLSGIKRLARLPIPTAYTHARARVKP